MWTGADLINAPATKRNPRNADLILELKRRYDAIKFLQPQDITNDLNILYIDHRKTKVGKSNSCCWIFQQIVL